MHLSTYAPIPSVVKQKLLAVKQSDHHIFKDRFAVAFRGEGQEAQHHGALFWARRSAQRDQIEFIENGFVRFFRGDQFCNAPISLSYLIVDQISVHHSKRLRQVWLCHTFTFAGDQPLDRKSTRLNSSHVSES